MGGRGCRKIHLLPPFLRRNDTENRQNGGKYMNRIKRGLWIIGLIICVCVLIFSAYSIYEYFSEAEQREQEFAELAEMVGYENVNTFLRQFKEKMDVSPLQYRKRRQQAMERMHTREMFSRKERGEENWKI